MKKKAKKKKINKKDEVELLNTSIGLARKHKLEYSLDISDIFRLLILFSVFSIPFIFWNNLITGLGIGLLLTLLFEFSAVKNGAGVLEIVGTGEGLIFNNNSIWGKLNSLLGYWFVISIIVSVVAILSWLGVV